MLRRLATLLMIVASTSAAAQWLTLRTPGIPRTSDGRPDLAAPVPRTADGRPDLTGLWVPRRSSGELFDPAKIKPWARTLMEERERQFARDDPRFRCLPSGPGILLLGGPAAGIRRIVQHASVVAILHADMTYRQIFMDGRELEVEPLPTWMGYSVGRWNGDTLVVESNGYNDKTWLHRDGLSHTEQLRITERYRRLDFGHLVLDVTYEDPGTFDSPVHAAAELELLADEELLEEVCSEASLGNSSRWSGGISEVEVEVAPEVLARYVGTYTGTWLRSRVTAEFTLEDGELALLRTPPYAEAELTRSGRPRLIPQSQNAFECTCGVVFVFSTEGEGPAPSVSEVHVSGAWTLERSR